MFGWTSLVLMFCKTEQDCMAYQEINRRSRKIIYNKGYKMHNKNIVLNVAFRKNTVLSLNLQYYKTGVNLPGRR